MLLKKYIMVQAKGKYANNVDGGIDTMKRRVIACIRAGISTAAIAKLGKGEILRQMCC